MEDLRFDHNRFPTFNKVKNEVIKDIRTIWTSSSIPYVSDKRTEEQLKSLLYDFKKESFKNRSWCWMCFYFTFLIFAFVSAIGNRNQRSKGKNLLQLSQRMTNPLSRYSAIGLTLCFDCFIIQLKIINYLLVCRKGIYTRSTNR